MNSAIAPSALLLALLAPFAAVSQVSLSINIRPPELPVYVQPPIPGDGYLWTPGYWGWSNGTNDYYWIPGTWVLPPTVGVLWTPGYWGFYGGGYRWRTGYWGPRVGFYGGIVYGHGYTGNGYHGGRWNRGAFQYNTSVNNIDKVVVRNVYNTTVVNNYNVKRVSFNGGPDGVRAEPTAKERKEQQAKHVDPTPNQVQHERTAMATPSQRASVNRGDPPVTATPKPSQFDGQDKKRSDDDGDASQAQKKSANERRQAQVDDAPQGKGEGKGKNDQKQDADRTTTPPDGAQPASRDNPAKRAQRTEAQTPQDATDGRTEQAKPKNEPRSQKPTESQPQQEPQAQSEAKQQPKQQQRQEQPPQQKSQQRESQADQQQNQQPRQPGKAQGENGKDKTKG